MHVLAWQERMIFLAEFLEPRSAEPHAAVIIPLDDCVLIVRLFNCAQLPSRYSKVAQTFNAISGIQLLPSRRPGERWTFGPV
jgi:hypothetical protein